MGKATQIYRNGTILTMDSRGSVASALAVEGSVVLAVGTDDDVMAHAGPDTVVTDLRGLDHAARFHRWAQSFCMGRAHVRHAA